MMSARRKRLCSLAVGTALSLLIGAGTQAAAQSDRSNTVTGAIDPCTTVMVNPPTGGDPSITVCVPD